MTLAALPPSHLSPCTDRLEACTELISLHHALASGIRSKIMSHATIITVIPLSRVLESLRLSDYLCQNRKLYSTTTKNQHKTNLWLSSRNNSLHVDHHLLEVIFLTRLKDPLKWNYSLSDDLCPDRKLHSKFRNSAARLWVLSPPTVTCTYTIIWLVMSSPESFHAVSAMDL